MQKELDQFKKIESTFNEQIIALTKRNEHLHEEALKSNKELSKITSLNQQISQLKSQNDTLKFELTTLQSKNKNDKISLDSSSYN